jgi:hypothetical protein
MTMTVGDARARKAELIAQVREGGVPSSWRPEPGWADKFTDDQIWDAWMEVAHDPKLTATPMMVAATLIEWFIDGKVPR